MAKTISSSQYGLVVNGAVVFKGSLYAAKKVRKQKGGILINSPRALVGDKYPGPAAARV